MKIFTKGSDLPLHMFRVRMHEALPQSPASVVKTFRNTMLLDDELRTEHMRRAKLRASKARAHSNHTKPPNSIQGMRSPYIQIAGDSDAGLHGPMLQVESDPATACLQLSVEVPKELEFIAPGVRQISLDAATVCLSLHMHFYFVWIASCSFVLQLAPRSRPPSLRAIMNFAMS